MERLLTERFQCGLSHALEVHADQRRKGSGVPYIAHLLGVTALVLEDHGDEDEAVAALLHDAVEDGDGQSELEWIRNEFGERVAAIVEGCSDAIPAYRGQPKEPWLPRKTAYIKHLRELDSDEAESIVRVSMADKVYNLRATVSDARNAADPGRFWRVFKTGPEGQLAYYTALTAVYRERAARSPMLGELVRLIRELESEMTVEQIEEAARIEWELAGAGAS